jgi:hypothetical protein
MKSKHLLYLLAIWHDIPLSRIDEDQITRHNTTVLLIDEGHVERDTGFASNVNNLKVTKKGQDLIVELIIVAS